MNESAKGLGGKWQLPGWRIEQKYSPGVLIGNWSESRFGKVSVQSQPTTNTDTDIAIPY